MLKVPGVLLSTTKAPLGRDVCDVSVEMLRAQSGGPLASFADAFRDGWFDPDAKQLRISFQIVLLFDRAQVDHLLLSVPAGNQRIPLPADNVASPAIGKQYSGVPWAASSRFVVNQVVNLPESALASKTFDLLAEVGGKQEKVGVLHVGNRFGGQSEPSLPHQPVAPVAHALETIAQVGQRRPMSGRVVDYVKGLDRLFLVTVIVPTLVAVVYFGLIGSDVYVSESSFVVRGQKQQMASPLDMMLKGGGFGSGGTENANYAVQSFILSRDALRALQKSMDIQKAYSAKSVDVFRRFAGLDWWNDSFEGLFRYYQDKVNVDIDSGSSIVKLTTRAFTADDSYKMNEQLLGMSEALINQLNGRARRDLIEFAEREVADAEKHDKEVTLALARAQTGAGRRFDSKMSLAGKLSEYERLAMEKDVADKVLGTAMQSLADARSQALQKQLYLERIAEPSKPDVAIEPRRARTVLAVFVLGLVTWGVLTMLIAGVKEHQD